MSTAQEDTTPESSATPLQRRGMRNAVIAQCFGELGYQAFQSGIMLLYLTALGFSSSVVFVCQSIPFAISAVGVVPSALLADRWGKKRIGMPGVVLTAAGFVILAMVGGTPAPARLALTLAGAAVFGLGVTLMETSWFALLSPIVPDSIRGRFFGVLRTSWQAAGVAMIGICGLFLTQESPISSFQWVVALFAGLMAVRIWFYARIPDIEPVTQHHEKVTEMLGEIVRAPGYASFCAYAFLLTLCTAGVPILFGLVEKKVLMMGDNEVVWMGNMLMIGSIAGFWFGGKLVDRYTTKPVFLACHFGFAALTLLFVVRDLIPVPILWLAGTINFFFGLTMAASGIAITTETLALIPPRNKSLSTSCCRMLTRLGLALSGMLSAWVLKTGMLTESWTLWGLPMSAYDTILLLTAVMVVLFVVTLGLVPSVLRKAELIPGR